MTVSTQDIRVTHLGDGTSTSFTIPWMFYANADIDVFVGGNPMAVGYSIAGAGTGSGTLNMAVAPAAGVSVQILLSVPLTQLVALGDGTAFPSATLNQVNDRAMQAILRMQDQIDRCIKAPDGDVSPAMELPLAPQRANMLSAYDAQGNLSLALTIPSGTLTQSVFNTFLANSPLAGGQTPAELAASVTPLNTAYPELNIRRYWTGTGSIYAAVATALLVAAQYSGSGGSRVRFPFGAYTVDSASLATAWLVPANTKIEGDGRDVTAITVTGTNQIFCIFDSIDSGGIEYMGLSLIGNSVANAFAVGCAIRFDMTTANSTPLAQLHIHDCYFRNFKADYWLLMNNQSITQMRGVQIHDNYFQSFNGNTRDPADHGVNSACIAFQGNNTNSLGYFVDTQVYNNIADCTFMKMFCIHWHGNYTAQAFDNIVIACGTDSQFPNNNTCYGFLAYDNAHVGSPPNVKYSNNIVGAVRSDGFYTADAGTVEYYYNTVANQIDTNNATLPKGAFGINQPVSCTMVGNRADNCVFGLDLVMRDGGVYNIDDLKITNTVANGTGITVAVEAASQADVLNMTNIHVEAFASGGTGMLLEFISTAGVNKFILDGFYVQANADGIQFFNFDSTVPKLRDVHIANGDIYGCSNGSLVASGFTDPLTRMTLSNLKFSGGGTATNHMNIAGCLNVTVRDIEFCDYQSGTGTCLSAAGAQGRMSGVQYNNVAPSFRFAASSLGTALPTWTGNANDFVQNLDLAETGSSGSKYQILGWNWDVTNAKWNAQRALTGN